MCCRSSFNAARVFLNHLQIFCSLITSGKCSVCGRAGSGGAMAHLQGAHPRQAQYNLELCWGRIFPHTHKRTLKLTASVTQPMRLCLYKGGPPSVNLHNTVYSSHSCLCNILRTCVKPITELQLNRITELRKDIFKVKKNGWFYKNPKLYEDL